MKKTMLMIAAALALAACSSTFNGVKADSSRNLDKTVDAAETGWEKVKAGTGKAVEKTGSAIERVGSAIRE